MCNMTFVNHKDYRFKVKDFVWDIKIEGQVGEIYVKGSNILFGRNWDLTFLKISPDNGAVLNTLYPFTIEDEKEYHRVSNFPVDKLKYSNVTLKSIERQYRGDTETYYLNVKTLSNNEFKILFSRRQFFSVQDITFFKEGKYIMTYNGESGCDTIPYHIHIGLFDLGKIIKNK